MKKKESLKNLRDKDLKALTLELQNAYQKLMQLQFDKTLAKNKNKCAIKNQKKEIARIWSIIGEKAAEKGE